jgi:hypothetical protein
VPSPTLRRGSPVLAAALAAAALAACSAAAPAQPAPAGSAGRPGVPGISGPPAIKANPDAGSAGYNVRPRITVPPVPPAGSPEPSLPVDAYIQTSVQQDETLSTAAAQVAQRCMSAAGFSYPVAPQPNYDAIFSQQFDHQNAGLTSLAQARSYGFQPPPDMAKIFAIRHLNQLPTFAAEQRKHGTAWASALVGEVPGMKPGTPPLGCVRAANMLMFGNFNGSLVGGTPTPIDFNAIKWTESDPHVLAAQRTWSACMARHGLRFTRMADLTAGRVWPDPPTPAEIAAAVTEVRCNHQANLANTYLTVEAAYQRALIGQNQPDLQQMQADFGTLQKRAAQVLARPAADILRLSKARVHQVSYLLIPRAHASHQGT